MQALLKNKLFLIGVIVVVILIGAGVWFFMGRGGSSGDQAAGDDISQNVVTVKPEEIGLVLTPRADGKAITMKITKLNGIKSIEYDVSYDANVIDEGETVTVPRGVVGSAILVMPGDSEVSRDLDLGTCSRNVCKYDDVVGPVKFVLKVTYTSGKVASVEKSINIQ